MGSLGVLNVSGGDIEIKFDTQDVAEAIRAKRMITDMLRRGYALLIEVEGKFTRCLEFKEDVGVYVVADFNPIAEENDGERRGNSDIRVQHEPVGASDIPAPESSADSSKGESVSDAAPGRRGRPKKSQTREVPMETAKARGVPRTAGG